MIHNVCTYMFLGTEEVLAMMEVYKEKCSSYENWLLAAEQVLIDCGTIGADLKRIEEQEIILQVRI